MHSGRRRDQAILRILWKAWRELGRHRRNLDCNFEHREAGRLYQCPQERDRVSHAVAGTTAAPMSPASSAIPRRRPKSGSSDCRSTETSCATAFPRFVITNVSRRSDTRSINSKHLALKSVGLILAMTLTGQIVMTTYEQVKWAAGG